MRDEDRVRWRRTKETHHRYVRDDRRTVAINGTWMHNRSERPMTPDQISVELDRIVAADDFPRRSAEMVDRWIRETAGVDAVAPILRFIEEHSAVDFGAPGALVHLVERFYGRGYEDMLVESVLRRPTAHNAWMLNRVINGTKDATMRDHLVSVMRQAQTNGLADAETRKTIGHFLERFDHASG
jgi:hypothetical protein